MNAPEDLCLYICIRNDHRDESESAHGVAFGGGDRDNDPWFSAILKCKGSCFFASANNARYAWATNQNHVESFILMWICFVPT